MKTKILFNPIIIDKYEYKKELRSDKHIWEKLLQPRNINMNIKKS
jgi:hypothetical protein